MLFKATGGVMAAIAGILLLIVIGYGIFLFTFGLQVATAGLIGRGNAHIQINSANFRITAYDHFFNLCAAVQADDSRLDALATELEQSPDNTDRGRILTNITGVAAARAESIAQYNADARKSYTEGQFRSSQLPYQLPTSEHVKGVQVSCNA